MSEPAAHIVSNLRIRVNASDARRRAALEAVVMAQGHVLAAESTDIILSDGDCGVVAGIPVVVLGSADEEHQGVLPRDASAEQIDAALRAVAAGLIVRLAETDAAFEVLSEAAPQTLLTPRETEVLSAIADGLSNKEIARRFEISLHTVKFHVEAVLRKLGARSRAEAVAKGLAHRKSAIEF